MAIVSCTECGKRLKIADASLGKKVKCTCGQVFVAEEEAPESAPPPRPTPAPAAEKVLVACTECGAKLKVGTASLGKKMKCPKCTAVFIASIDEPPAPDIEIETDDEPAPPPPKPKAKGKPARDEDDDLFSFAQAESNGDYLDDEPPAPKPKGGKKPAPLVDEDDDDMPPPAPKSKLKKPLDEEEEDDDLPMPAPKGKLKKPIDDDDDADEDDDEPRSKSKKPTRSSPAKKDEPLKYPSRLPVNIIVFLMLFAYLGAFGAFFMDMLPRADLEEYGWPKIKLAAGKPLDKGKGKGKGPEIKIKEDRQAIFVAREKEEKALLTEYRKNPRPDVPGAVVTIQAKGTKVLALAFAPTGQKLATWAVSPDSALMLWNLADLKPDKKISVKSPAAPSDGTLAFSHDGNLLALISEQEHDVKVFDVKEGKEVKTLDLGKGAPTSIAFSVDGSLIVVVKTAGEEHDKVRMYDTKKWNEFPSKDVFAKGWSVVSPGGDKIIEVNKDADELAVRESATGKSVKFPCDPRLKTRDFFDGAVSSDGSLLVLSFKKDDTIHQLVKFEVKDKGETAILHEGPQPAVGPRFSHDGKRLICNVEGQDHLIDVEAKKSLWSREADSSAFAFSPGGIFAASGLTSMDNAAIHLLPIEDLKAKEVTTPPKKEPVKTLAEKIAERRKAEIALLAELRKTQKPGSAAVITPKNQFMKALAFHPTMPVLATCAQGADPDEAITLWDLATLMPIKSMAFTPPEPTAQFHMTFSPDGALLALGSDRGALLKVWDVKDGSEVHDFKLDKADNPQQIAFTPDGKQMLVVVSEGKDAYVRIWSLADWNKMSTLKLLFSPTSEVMVSPAGDKVIEVKSDASEMAIHDMTTTKAMRVKPAPDLRHGGSLDRALSPDGRSIAFPGEMDGKPQFLIYDLEKAEATKLFDGPGAEPQFSPDGKYLICNRRDEDMLIDVAKQKIVWTRKSNSRGHAFSSGGVFFAFTDQAAIHLLALEDALKQGPEVTKGEVKPKDKGKDPAENKDPKLAKFFERQKEEKTWLAAYRETPPKDLPGVAGVLNEPGVIAIAFAPAEQLFATAAPSDKEGVKVWDLATLQTTKTIPMGIPTQRALLAFSPDGEFLAVLADQDKFGKGMDLKIWKVADAAEVKAIAIPMPILFNKDMIGLRFTSDGKRLTLLLRDQAKGFEAASWTGADWEEKKWDPQSKFGHCFFSHSGDLLYECSNETGITIRDLLTDKTRPFNLKDTANWDDRATPDDKYYVKTKAGAFGDFQFVDMNTSAVIEFGREKAINRLQFTGDSKYMLFALGNVEAKLVEIATKKEVWKAPGNPLMAISPGGVFVARVEKGELHLLAIEDLLAGKYKPSDKKEPEKKEPKNVDPPEEKPAKKEPKVGSTLGTKPFAVPFLGKTSVSKFID